MRGGSIKELWYGRRMGVSELESTYSFYDLSHLYNVGRDVLRGSEEKNE